FQRVNDAKIGVGPAMPQPGVCDVGGGASRSEESILPLALVTRTCAQVLAEGPNSVERRATDCHIRTPEEWTHLVIWTEVEFGREPLASATEAGLTALNPHANRPAQT